MQFILSVNYLLLYLVTTFTLIVLFTNFSNPHLLRTLSINLWVSYVRRYSRFSYLFFLILLGFSGLPPLNLFFVKFMIFLHLLGISAYTTSLCIFGLFLVNMFFYLQIFKFRHSNYHHISTIKLVILQKKNLNFNAIVSNPYTQYGILYFVILTILFLYGGIFIATDIMIIFKNLLY